MANNKLLREWKHRLGLGDWRIELIDNMNPEDMKLENSAGDVDWSEPIKTARIEIINPKFYGKRIVPFDYEKTLVHELLHLKLCLVSDNVGEFQARYMHQIIDDLARALVDAKRYGRGGQVMAEYIERDAAIKTINKYRIGLRAQGLVILDGAVAEVKKRIDSLPNAEVRPAVRGKWEHGREIARTMLVNETLAIEYEDWHCSACGAVVEDYEFPRYKFCPNCGADMREPPKEE